MTEAVIIFHPMLMVCVPLLRFIVVPSSCKYAPRHRINSDAEGSLLRIAASFDTPPGTTSRYCSGNKAISADENYLFICSSLV